jgi:hypothetical protein
MLDEWRNEELFELTPEEKVCIAVDQAIDTLNRAWETLEES